ncbi:hypothetical protein HSBGL_2691 [Halapricum desulfuricans]|uniref:DUF4260 family protein n=1 Tax=Halapricum desulfuricans TaxID=2841257 RepID=A0A897NLE1_9EURY|nr:DUF4260 domain-containing protein [Halapricum desulfuricans]QSG13091.1 hypothetical protein HSBGL_2691 [Halapricum desulfuricans]
MEPRTYLRLEGVTVFVSALAAFFVLDGPLWLLAVLALAPDLAMVGYLAGPEVGSLSYNTAHTYVLPAALGGAGLYADVTTAVLVALIWGAHIGADRAVGYGLKYSSGFKDTHLSIQPAPVSAFVDHE